MVELLIFKFGTMVKDADKLGTAVTQQNDPRISKVGHKLVSWWTTSTIIILIGDMRFCRCKTGSCETCR